VPLVSAEIPAGPKPVTNPMKGLVAWGENYRQDPYVAFAIVPVVPGTGPVHGIVKPAGNIHVTFPGGGVRYQPQ
ncbi:hypothetical protein H6B10_17170, partial [Gemmiger formicilis]|uniref:hypothetical protein n=1 Tax=Gemmiger formicilis TaxID=745368 RepID=UPI00195DB61A